MALPRRSSSSRSGNRTTRLLLVLTAVTLLVLDLPGTRPLRPVRNAIAVVFSPIQAAGRTVFAPIGNGWRGAFGYGEVQDENAELRARLDELESQDAELERLRTRVAELEAMNQVEVEGVEVRLAEVGADPISNFDQSIRIDLGSRQGVKRGMAVLSGRTDDPSGGLLGRVDQVRANSATIKLITTPSFAVGAVVGDEIGVVEGQGRGENLRLTGIGIDAEIEVGDWVYTSPSEDSQFPRDVVIGRVASAEHSDGDLSWTIEVEPLADLGARLVKVAYKDPPR